jgi:hypothetical protein
MDRNSMLFAPAIFALSLSASVHAGDQPVKVNVSHLQPSVAREVERHAALGMTSLTRYLEATASSTASRSRTRRAPRTRATRRRSRRP